MAKNKISMAFDAYRGFEYLKEQLNFVLNNFGAKYDIKF